MRPYSHIFTSESVSEGHPDKVCDRISDEIVDIYLRADPGARVAAETMVTTNRVVIAGEVRSATPVRKEDIAQAARAAVRDIGYAQDNFHWRNLHLDNWLHQQSPDIAMGVDSDKNGEEGAGDQGIMFGYACRETPDLMPAPIYYAHRILSLLAAARHKGDLPQLGPDAKSQISIAYRGNTPIKAESIVVSTQHDEGLCQEDVRRLVRPYVEEALPEGWMCPEKTFYVNPTGRFVQGGPDADCGLTGRKIIVDTYGGAAPHGGGAFSGKDPSKVDRSGAYAARYLAKNIVAAGLSDRCVIQISYAIGVAQPISLYIDLGSNDKESPNKESPNRESSSKVRAADIAKGLGDIMDLSPHGIRRRLHLRQPIYARTAAYGHFGRATDDDGFPWENTDLVETLRQYFSI